MTINFHLIRISSLKLLLYTSSVLAVIKLSGQDSLQVKAVPDTVIAKSDMILSTQKQVSFSYKKLILPTVLIGYGVGSLTIPALKQLNLSTRNHILKTQPGRTHFDDYTILMPAIATYGLYFSGVKTRDNLRDMSLVYATSLLLATTSVHALKYTVNKNRPDNSGHGSFPSGHSAYAFASAQLMFREFQDTNFWLAISGYPFALFTATYRVINNKHWVGDVVAGAGFGILSTEAAFWLLPTVKRLFKIKNTSTVVMPIYQNHAFGLGYIKVF